VLASDFADSALALSDGHHNRALLVLRRMMFEYMTRLRFFRQRPDIARAHLDEFTPRVRLFQQRLTDNNFRIILDPAFEEALHDPQKHYRNFMTVLSEVFPNNAEDLYAQFYQYPSALMHGEALASADILELSDDGTWTVHHRSRRTNTNETLLNYLAFFVSLLEDGTAILNIRHEHVAKLRDRQQTVRQDLNMELQS
jgi:hypothetical protein